ncbi:MAG: glycoside hydrolase family 18 protein, partial [Sarcina sp.]
MSSKQVIIYFPNWGTYNVNHQNVTVGMIPWEKVTIVQHAFFAIGSDWKLVSTDEWADFQKPYEHSATGDSGLKGHLGEYRYYKSIYKDKKLLLSIGGWTKSYNFSEMASNVTYRKIFISSCINFLKNYPFFDGLDIDWEYPQAQDKTNFTILLKEIKQAFNDNNMSNKLLTIAVPAGKQNIINQDIKNYKNYVDLVNIMSYDYYGAWNSNTNHHSPLYYNSNNKDINALYFNVDSSVKSYLDGGIESNKLCIGSPLYSRGWKEVDFSSGINEGLYSKGNGAPVGTWDEPWDPGGQNPWYQLKKLEKDMEWKKYYDNIAKAPYLVNKNKKYFLTYEDELALQEKCNYIISNKLAGLIIWEISGDDLINNAPMINIAGTILSKGVISTIPVNTLPANVTVPSY